MALIPPARRADPWLGTFAGKPQFARLSFCPPADDLDPE